LNCYGPCFFACCIFVWIAYFFHLLHAVVAFLFLCYLVIMIVFVNLLSITLLPSACSSPVQIGFTV
jgi:hypothetical protein